MNSNSELQVLAFFGIYYQIIWMPFSSYNFIWSEINIFYEGLGFLLWWVRQCWLCWCWQLLFYIGRYHIEFPYREKTQKFRLIHKLATRCHTESITIFSNPNFTFTWKLHWLGKDTLNFKQFLTTRFTYLSLIILSNSASTNWPSI